jgi:hypothetical protein
MRKIFIVLLALTAGVGAMSNDTTKLLYGVSNEPLTITDTATVRHYHKTGDGYYLLPLSGGELWAAWIKPIREVSCVK